MKRAADNDEFDGFARGAAQRDPVVDMDHAQPWKSKRCAGDAGLFCDWLGVGSECDVQFHVDSVVMADAVEKEVG